MLLSEKVGSLQFYMKRMDCGNGKIRKRPERCRAG